MRIERVAKNAVLSMVGLSFLLVQNGSAQSPRAKAPTSNPATPVNGDRDGDAEAIRAIIDSFTKAYNAKDSKALGALFTEGAEIEDEVGAVTRGRDAIVERFSRLFSEGQGGTLNVTSESLSFLSASLAIERGTARITTAGNASPETSRYSVTYVKQDGRWYQARIEDKSDSDVAPHERLKQLEWMLGDWINESDDAIVLTTCKWSADGNFLLRDFDVKIEGRVSLSGTQRIGWDPLHEQFRTWVFDTEGGFADGLMSRDNDRWVIKAHGVRADGEAVSVTNIITVLGKDRIGWESVDRTIGGDAIPDIDQFVIVRRPPPPGGGQVPSVKR